MSIFIFFVLFDYVKLIWINIWHIFTYPLDHLADYFEATGKTLLNHTDELVENMHQQVYKRLVASNYVVKNIQSPTHGKRLFAGVIHHNSYAIDFH